MKSQRTKLVLDPLPLYPHFEHKRTLNKLTKQKIEEGLLLGYDRKVQSKRVTTNDKPHKRRNKFWESDVNYLALYLIRNLLTHTRTHGWTNKTDKTFDNFDRQNDRQQSKFSSNIANPKAKFRSYLSRLNFVDHSAMAVGFVHCNFWTAERKEWQVRRGGNVIGPATR